VPQRSVVTLGLAVFLLAGCPRAHAQPAGPVDFRHLSGSLEVGWLDTTTTDLYAGSTRNPFTSIRFDYRDAVIDPAFISFRVQPVFGIGFQDLFGTASPRSGVAAELSFLPARPFPLRLYYSRFHRKTLAASTRSYTRVLAQNDDWLVGLQWRLLVPQWPKLDVSASESDVTTRPEEVLTSGYGNHSRNLAVTGNDTRWGWTLDGIVQFQRLDAERLGASASGPVPFDTTTDLRLLRLLGRRELGRWFSVSLNANGTLTDSRVANGTYRHQHETYSARLLFEPSPRFTSWAEGRLTYSDLEARSADVSDGPGCVVPRTETADRSADWEARYEILQGLSLLGRLEFTRVTTSSPPEPGQRQDFLNSVGGVRFLRDAGWLSLSGSYTLNRFLRQAERASESVSESDLVGHAADANVSVGRPSAVRVTLGYSVSRSRQEVRATLPYISNSQRIRTAIEKDFGRGSRVQLHWNVTDTSYDTGRVRSDFRGQGYGGSMRVRTMSVSFDHGYGSGHSAEQSLDPLLALVADAPPVFLVGSDSEYTTASAHWQVTPSLSLRGMWRDQRQAVGALQTSRVEQREATVRYDFRLIHLEGGYLLYRFDFGSPVFRKSLILRVVRDFRVF